MDEGDKDKRGVEVKKHTVVLHQSQISFGEPLESHINMVNGAAMKDQNQGKASYTKDNIGE